MTMGRADLVQKGFEALEEADRNLRSMDYREAEIRSEMASAYARLAEAIGDRRISGQARRY